MANRVSFAPNEWYHCYSRGVDKRTVFETSNDFERFLQLLYLLNNKDTVHRSDFKKTSTPEILQIPRGKQIVAIGAYCLMPNHFHLLLKEGDESGISRFMRKLGIAYAMYFNIKNERVGNLFVKPFRSKHITNDRYLKRVVQYIHLNVAELFEPGWKMGKVKNARIFEKKLQQYRYSSLPDYCGANRPEQTILDQKTRELFEDLPPITAIIDESIEYYRTMSR
jgi:putative transposase